MNSSEYWKDRFVELKISRFKKIDLFARQLEDLHNRTQKKINDDIILFYKKVATANGISMADAKKLMCRKDRKEFQWTLEEYQQHAKADLLSGITSSHVMNASANWHLSYLDGMKLQLEHHVDKLYKNIDSKTRNHFKESLNENYLNTAFELQKGIGIGEKMEVPYDERKLENILRTPWASDGKNFSNRIWRDRTQLVNNLQKNLSESVIRGDSDTDMIQALSKDEKKAKFNTRRLIETESAYFDSMSEQQCCEDFGVEKYRFLAVLDMKTSDICQELDNKVFLEKDRQVGVNAPPMHPFCRSTTAPVIDEDFLTSRRAKNPKTGEYDEISPDLSYEEWKQKFVINKEHNQKEKANKSKNLNVSDERRIKKVKNRIKKSKRKGYTENLIAQFENNSLDTLVDWDYINSPDFEKNCESIPNNISELLIDCGLLKESDKEEFLLQFENTNFTQRMIEYGKKIIKDNEGMKTETSFILTYFGEELKGKDFNQSLVNNRNILNQEQRTQLHNLKVRNILRFLIHNHTIDSPSSPEDYRNYYIYRYTCGIVFTNKGSIYLYVGTNDNIDTIEDDKIRQIRNNINLNRILNNDNENEVFKTVYNSDNLLYYGFRFLHIGRNGKKYYSYK